MNVGMPELVIFLFMVSAQAFWIWMLVDCLTNVRSEGNDKKRWALIIIFAMLPGAILYFIYQRPKNINGG